MSINYVPNQACVALYMYTLPPPPPKKEKNDRQNYWGALTAGPRPSHLGLPIGENVGGYV